MYFVCNWLNNPLPKVNRHLTESFTTCSLPLLCPLLSLVTGTLIRRQRVPLPPPDDDQFYNVFHFNINQQMELYSRTFTVTNCDSFTRNFLTKLGVRLNNPAAVPVDPYSDLREQVGLRVFCFSRFLL